MSTFYIIHASVRRVLSLSLSLNHNAHTRDEYEEIHTCKACGGVVCICDQLNRYNLPIETEKQHDDRVKNANNETIESGEGSVYRTGKMGLTAYESHGSNTLDNDNTWQQNDDGIH